MNSKTPIEKYAEGIISLQEFLSFEENGSYDSLGLDEEELNIIEELSKQIEKITKD